ncbi:uncharacterized protein METZ01_LOCUS209616, partial [marine metagenome]
MRKLFTLILGTLLTFSFMTTSSNAKTLKCQT